MTRMIHSLGIGFVGASAALAICLTIVPTAKGRTLSENEMHSLFGGWPSGDDYCCIDFGWCDEGTASSCHTKTNQAECIVFVQIAFTQGNKEVCEDWFTGANCTETGEYNCRTVTACAWDNDEDECKLSQFPSHTSVPVECSDAFCF